MMPRIQPTAMMLKIVSSFFTININYVNTDIFIKVLQKQLKTKN